MLHIEIIGAIDQQAHYDPTHVVQLLRCSSETLLLGSDFIGRPGTHIYADDHHVIKVRAEFNFTAKQARLWTLKTLHKEQQLGVHHPYKTWLLITKPATDKIADEESVLIASICPRLKPLHIELKLAPASIAERQRYLALFHAVFSMYFILAKTSSTKLDEGLSNFAVANDGVVYYLDDEYYLWDKFVSFAIMLGVYIRSFDWLDTEFISELSQILIERLSTVFQDNHCRLIIARQLHSLFMPQGKKEQLLLTLINALLNINKIAVSDNNKIIERHERSINNTIKPIISGRYLALLADIHANYDALCYVLDYLDEHAIKQGLVLGDVVGYGPEPKECIERLQQTNFRVIKGNHDHAVALGNIDVGFSGYARSTIQWTINQLSLHQRQWLDNLPVFEENAEWFAVHGSPMDPEFFYGYVYMMTYEDNLAYMADKNMRLCFHGHSHISGIFARDKNNRDLQPTGKRIFLNSYNHALVCPGSVGQPRNGCPMAQFAIYDREQHEISFIGIPYPVEPVIQKMRVAGLPEELGQRLLIGR